MLSTLGICDTDGSGFSGSGSVGMREVSGRNSSLRRFKFSANSTACSVVTSLPSESL